MARLVKHVQMHQGVRQFVAKRPSEDELFAQSTPFKVNHVPCCRRETIDEVMETLDFRFEHADFVFHLLEPCNHLLLAKLILHNHV